jgi:hypothetical protein
MLIFIGKSSKAFEFVKHKDHFLQVSILNYQLMELMAKRKWTVLNLYLIYRYLKNKIKCRLRFSKYSNIERQVAIYYMMKIA